MLNEREIITNIKKLLLKYEKNIDPTSIETLIQDLYTLKYAISDPEKESKIEETIRYLKGLSGSNLFIEKLYTLIDEILFSHRKRNITGYNRSPSKKEKINLISFRKNNIWFAIPYQKVKIKFFQKNFLIKRVKSKNTIWIKLFSYLPSRYIIISYYNKKKYLVGADSIGNKLSLDKEEIKNIFKKIERYKYIIGFIELSGKRYYVVSTSKWM